MSELHKHLPASELVDRYEKASVSSSTTCFEGHVWDVVSEEFTLPGQDDALTREFVKHPGAVAVLAMRGEPGNEEVLVIQQYRHPVGAWEWEIPAGLLDVDGEPADKAALRELYEEADLRAGKIDILLDYASSPGGLSEQMRIFLARDIEEVDEKDRFEREEEELDMPTAWVGLDDVITNGLAGKIHCPTLLMSAFAASQSRAKSWSTLRLSDSPWPEHPAFR